MAGPSDDDLFSSLPYLQKLSQITGYDPSQYPSDTAPAQAADSVGKLLDSYTGAPTRAALGAMQQGKPMGDAFSQQMGDDPSKAPSPKDLLANDPSGATAPYADNPLMQTAVGAAADWTLPAGALAGAAAHAVPAIRATEMGGAAEDFLKALAADEAGVLRVPGEKNQIGMYSKLERLIQNKMGGSATPEQIQGMLKEVKPEEVQYSGIQDFLKDKDKVSKEDLLNHLMNNRTDISEINIPESRARYQDYSLPGGDNYQEHVYELNSPHSLENNPQYLALADEYSDVQARAKARVDELRSMLKETNPNYNLNDLNAAVADDDRIQLLNDKLNSMDKQFDDMHRSQQRYESSHWRGMDNPIAHMRTQNFLDSEGNKVLHGEEFQSDWHQEGRQKGYASPATRNLQDLDNQRNSLFNQQDELNDKLWTLQNAPYELSPEEKELLTTSPAKLKDIQGQIENINQKISGIIQQEPTVREEGVPDAPLKKTWHEFLLKQLIKKAAEQDADKISWTTGAQQAQRYNLGDKIDELRYRKSDDGQIHLIGQRGQDQVFDQIVPADSLSNLVGKDVAAKIQSSDKDIGSLSGNDLMIGGQGMSGFYDKIVPDYLKKLGKQYGAEVGTTELKGGGKVWSVINPTTGEIAPIDPPPLNQEAAKAAFEEVKQREPEYKNWELHSADADAPKVHSMTITPALKKAALEDGFPLFMLAPFGLNQQPDEPRDYNALKSLLKPKSP